MSIENEYDPNWPDRWPLPQSLENEPFWEWVRSLDSDGYDQVTEEVLQWIANAPKPITVRVVNKELGFVWDVQQHILHDGPLNPLSDLYMVRDIKDGTPDNVVKGPWSDPEDSPA